MTPPTSKRMASKELGCAAESDISEEPFGQIGQIRRTSSKNISLLEQDKGQRGRLDASYRKFIVSYWNDPMNQDAGLEYLASMARTLLKRRTKRGSVETKLAARKASATSWSVSVPMTRAPRTRTFMSSCSTPWCAE